MNNSGCGGCDEITLPLGTAGVDGKNAFTITTSPFTQPPTGGAFSVNVSNAGQFSNQWATFAQIIAIFDSSGQGGWYLVNAITGSQSMVITNLGYAGSTQSGITINSGASVSPSGPPGANGTNGQNGQNGINGSQGPAGTPGSALLASSPGVQNNTATMAIVAGTYNLGNGLLLFPQDNDKIVIDALFNNFPGIGKAKAGYFEVCMIDTSVHSISTNWYGASGGELVLFSGRSANVRVEVYRVNQSEVRFAVTYTDSSGLTASWGLPGGPGISMDLTGNISIYINGRLDSVPAAGAYIECVQCSITSYRQ